MTFDYKLESGKLKVTDSVTGDVIWEGDFEGVPVQQIMESPNGLGCLVLLDPSSSRQPTFENLLMVDYKGHVIWKAQLPEFHDAYVDIVNQGNQVAARTWNGSYVQFDLGNGCIIKHHYVK